MATPIFDHTHSKIDRITFSIPEFIPTCKKSIHSIYSFLKYSQFYWPHQFFNIPISKGFWSTFNYINLHQHVNNFSDDIVD